MAEDLQGLLEKINREGVEKAQAKAQQITAEATEKAAAIVAEARSQAAALVEKAQRDADEYAARAKETLRQAARDTVCEVREATTALLERLLAKDVETALGDPATVGKLIAETLVSLAGEHDREVTLNAKLAPALKAQLAACGDLRVTLDERREAGFSVKVDGGRVEHSFTTETVAQEIARRLRPDLAALFS